MWPRTGSRHGNVVDAFFTRQMTVMAWLELLYSQQTQQSPESVVPFRRTGWKASVLGGLPHADGVVGAVQLLASECIYRNDTATVLDVLSPQSSFQTTHLFTERKRVVRNKHFVASSTRNLLENVRVQKHQRNVTA